MKKIITFIFLALVATTLLAGNNDLLFSIIPDSVTSIGDDAFYECSSLISITVPKSLTNIGDDAFACCGNLKADSKSTHEHSITVGCGILCFLFPVVGWILHLTWKKEFPEKAKACEKVATWGFLLHYAIYLLLVN